MRVALRTEAQLITYMIKKFVIMKKFLFSFLAFILLLNVNAQDVFHPTGKVQGKIYFNYHLSLNNSTTQASAFEIKRAYFGYNYAFSKNLSTSITLDVGKNSSGSAYTYYLKKASLDWKLASSLKLSIGLIGMQEFNNQESFWGYRYVYKSFMDEHGFGSSADLGVNAHLTFLKNKLNFNVFVANGEGYKSLQDNYGKFKVGGNVIIKPVKDLEFKFYYDTKGFAHSVNGAVVDASSVSVYAFFLGYRIKSKFRIGAEYDVMLNGEKYSQEASGHNLNGLSFYGIYTVNKKIELFGRYDNMISNILANAANPWNYGKDGNAIIFGCQYSPVKGVKMALNYQGWTYTDPNVTSQSLAYLNFQYKF